MLAVCLAVPSLAVAQAGDTPELAGARERLDRIADDIAAAEDAAADADAELADAEERLAQVEAVVNDVAAALERQEAAVAEATAELAEVEAVTARIQAAFDDRAATMFKQGSVLPFEVVMSSGDLDDAVARTSFLRFILSADQANLETLHNAEIVVTATRERLEDEQRRLERMQAEQAELLAVARRLRESKALAAADARAQVAGLEAEQDQLEADERRLEELIRSRQGPPPTMSSPSQSGYLWPLCGAVTSEFGWRWGRPHTGLDIDDNATRTIVAAKGGTVIFAGWEGGYGMLTLVDHGDGVVTAYAHQSAQAVRVGQGVAAGQTIGTVGSTGNSTGPHLHFETRVNGGAVDPRGFLSGAC